MNLQVIHKNMTFEVFMAVNTTVEFFWTVTLHTFQMTLLPPSAGWSEDGGCRVLWNDGIIPQHYSVPQPRQPQPESNICS